MLEVPRIEPGAAGCGSSILRPTTHIIKNFHIATCGLLGLPVHLVGSFQVLPCIRPLLTKNETMAKEKPRKGRHFEKLE